MYGTDYRYAATRLNETIVRRNNQPVLVRNVSGDGMVDYYNILDGERGSCRLEDLDVRPMPLGYVNKAKKAYYMTRVPKRSDWRQGVRANNVMLVCRTPLRGMLHSLIRALYKNKTNFDGCFTEIAYRRASSMSFHQHWALKVRRNTTKSHQLCYKGIDNVGHVYEDKTFKLRKGCHHLKEYLEECLNAD